MRAGTWTGVLCVDQLEAAEAKFEEHRNSLISLNHQHEVALAKVIFPPRQDVLFLFHTSAFFPLSLCLSVSLC